MTTIVNITLVQEGEFIRVRSDSLGEDEEVLSLGLKIISYLAMVESYNEGKMDVEMPTLSLDTH